jgi:hypothetical protein
MSDSLHLVIRETYVNERRKFESRLSGRHSDYGFRHMPKWDGTEDANPGSNRKLTTDRYGKTYKPIWPKIAAFALKHNVDPLLLIKTRFINTRGPRPPEPTDCMCQAALEACVSERTSVDDLNKRLYEFQDIFEKEVESKARYMVRFSWSPDDVFQSVILDLTLPLSCLYRYCLAVVNGFNDLASVNKPEAILEYLRDSKAYDESAWFELIPKQFANEAKLTAF